jgi:hypothetical protein
MRRHRHFFTVVVPPAARRPQYTVRPAGPTARPVNAGSKLGRVSCVSATGASHNLLHLMRKRVRGGVDIVAAEIPWNFSSCVVSLPFARLR